MEICHVASNVSQYYTPVAGKEWGDPPIKKKAADLIVDPVSLSSVGYNNWDITHRASSVCQALSQFLKFYIH